MILKRQLKLVFGNSKVIPPGKTLRVIDSDECQIYEFIGREELPEDILDKYVYIFECVERDTIYVARVIGECK